MTSKKTATPKPAKKQTKHKTADKNQFERFVEAAREIGVDEDPEALDRAFDKIVVPSKSRRP
jgi:hypothetical protein